MENQQEIKEGSEISFLPWEEAKYQLAKIEWSFEKPSYDKYFTYDAKVIAEGDCRVSLDNKKIQFSCDKRLLRAVAKEIRPPGNYMKWDWLI